MTEEYFVDLGTGYKMAGYADFESAFAATDKLCGMGLKVAYLNEATHICEHEVMAYANKCCEAANAIKYQNYHYKPGEQPAATATESIRTALELLEKKTNYKVKFIAVFYPKAMKVPALQSRLR